MKYPFFFTDGVHYTKAVSDKISVRVTTTKNPSGAGSSISIEENLITSPKDEPCTATDFEMAVIGVTIKKREYIYDLEAVK